jgi:hypothetical protein
MTAGGRRRPRITTRVSFRHLAALHFLLDAGCGAEESTLGDCVAGRAAARTRRAVARGLDSASAGESEPATGIRQ